MTKYLIIFWVLLAIAVFILFKLAEAVSSYEDMVQEQCEFYGGEWTRYTVFNLFLDNGGCSFKPS